VASDGVVARFDAAPARFDAAERAAGARSIVPALSRHNPSL